jgi:coproporphyrinogen III oxidase-like Fe-S oxidoreductase
MSHRKKKEQQTPGNKKKVAHREHVDLRTWNKFERWQQHDRDLEDVISEIRDNFRVHSEWLVEYLGYGDEFEELARSITRLERLYYLIETGKRCNRQREQYFYDDDNNEIPYQKGKMLVVEVVIEEIGDGTL